MPVQRFGGRNAVIKIGLTSAASYDFSGDSNEAAFEVSIDTSETTGFGSDWKDFIKAQGEFTFSAKVFGGKTGLGTLSYINVTTAGSGYTSAPAISFTGGGGGTGAAATAVVDATGKVVGIIVTAQGSGYTSAPTVVFTGGGGTGAVAAAIVNGYNVPLFDTWFMGTETLYAEIRPFGTGSGLPVYSGSMIPTGYKPTTALGDAVMLEISGQGKGTFTYALQP